MVDSSQVEEGDALPPPASRVLSMERSLSPDLVSLSSTSGSETHSEEPEMSQQLSTSQDDSDITEGSSVPSNLALESDLGRPLQRLLIADGGMAEGSRQVDSTSPQLDSLCGEHVNEASVLSAPVQYQLVDKDKLTVSDYESRGLLYARASKARHNM